jgi:hypothetical protein
MPISRSSPTQPSVKTAAEAPSLKPRVVACQLVDAAAVRVWVELSNSNAAAVGLALPPMASIQETKPEFDEFQVAWDAADGPGLGQAALTHCGPGPGSRITLEPQQSVTRSVVFPIARWKEEADAYSTVRWRWRQFDLATPYEVARVSGCTRVALSLEQGHCAVEVTQAAQCPPAGAIDVEIDASQAEPPRR